MNTTEQTNTQSLPLSVLFATALILVLLVELIGNIVVLCVVYRQRRNVRQRVTNTLLANLAFIDLLVPTILIPFSLTVLIEGRHILTFAVCQINGFVNNLVGSASILTMAVIGIDRYVAIVCPRGRRLQYRHVRLFLFGVWLISVVMSLLPIIFWGEYKATEKSTSCKSDNGSYLLLLAIVCFIIPLATMVYCYTKVFLKIKHHRKQLESIKRNSRSIKTEFKTTKIVFVVLTAFIIAWTPFVVIYVVSSNKMGANIPPAIFKFSGLLAAVHSMCNPIIYFTMNKAFRRDALRLVPCLEKNCSRNRPESRSAPSSLNSGKMNNSPTHKIEVITKL